MLHILVVDDDITIRQAICKIIQNTHSTEGKLLVYQAANGIEAIEIVCSQQIDIIFTDIKMPVCTGIEMIRKLHELEYNIPTIIISGFDDYSLIRSALKLGAIDYILKPISSEELQTALQECLHKSYTKEEKVKFYNQDKIRHTQEIIFIQQRTIEQLIKGVSIPKTLITEDTEVLLCVLDICSKNIPNDEERQLIFLEIKHWINELYGDKTRLWQGMYNNDYILILPDFKEDINEINKLVAYLENKKIHFDMVSNTVPCIAIPSAYATLIKKMDECFYDIKLLQPISDEIYPYDSTIKDSISYICEYDFEGASECLTRLFHMLCRDKIPLGNTRKLLANILYAVMSKNSDFISVISNYKFTEKDLIYHIQSTVSAKVLCEKMTEMIHTYILDTQKKDVCRDTYHIQKAKRFIEQHYMHDISLTNISEKLGIHPNYFSSIFKCETGVTFSQYVRKIRIERAKVLIQNSNLKMYEVAEKVGYNDNTHFYRMFKEETSISPAQYKQKLNLS